jgi:5-methylcytosine-specific restriction endonuclease McrA
MENIGKVLVLNATETPINICSWRKAIKLTIKGKAQVIDHTEQLLTRSIYLPSIIRLSRYIPLPYQEVVLTRKNILLRDNYTCQYCGKKTQLTIDHVLPRSRGGRDIWTNVVVACQRCNHNKGHQTVLEAGMHLKAQPYKPPSALYLELTRYKNVPGSWIKYFHNGG